MRNNLRILLLNAYKNIFVDNFYKNILEIPTCEINYVLYYFKECIHNDKDFLEKYSKSISNLDDKSNAIFSSIISKISKMDYIDYKTSNCFSPEEEKEFIHSYYHHINKIIKINANCYLYDNKYILPVNRFEQQIFHEKWKMEENIYNLSFLLDKDIIDVGAFIGDSSIIFSEYTNRKVYAFEPLLYNYNMMLKTIELNKKSNIEPVYMALGNENSKIYFDNYNALEFMTQYRKDTYKINQKSKLEVDISTLDSFINNNNDIIVGLIKTDLEGFEQSFLEGDIETIKKYKPILMISIYHNYSDFFNIKTMIEELNLGYKFKIYKPTNKLIISETMLIAEVY